MKATKLIAIIAFAGLGLCAEGALAQGTDPVGDAPPPMSETAAPASGEEAQPYNETVTIDSGTDASAAAPDAGIAEQPEKKEKLRVYSGKHDGNNVIADPR
ncbi:MAG: hypothetical protein IPP71_12185 [Bacteroidetes bacterium]|nr:hypothetical protein [Bacteroidota bacterium]